MDFYELIQTSIGLPGTKKKEELLRSVASDPDIKDIFWLMLDTSILYNIKKVPEVHGPTEHEVYIDNDADFILALCNLTLKDLRGDALKFEVQELYNDLSNNLREVLIWVLDRKNPAKIGKSLVNKVWPGVIYTQDYMGAVPGTDDALMKLPWDTGVNVQNKEDGMSLLVHYKDGKPTELRTRQGQDITKYFPGFMQRCNHVLSLYHTDTFAFTGHVHHEVFVLDTEADILLDRKTGNGLINKQVKNGTIGGSVDDSLRSVLLDLKDDQQPDLMQSTRYHNLMFFVNNYSERVMQVSMSDIEGARLLAQDIIRRGGEGVICKDPSKPWKQGKPIWNVKIKNEFAVELKVIDSKPHSKKPWLIGSLLCASEDGILEVWVNARCDADRELDFFTYWQGGICQVKAESIIKSKGKKKPSLYLPRFDGSSFEEYVREEKVKADTYAEIKQQEKMSKGE